MAARGTITLHYGLTGVLNALWAPHSLPRTHGWTSVKGCWEAS